MQKNKVIYQKNNSKTSKIWTKNPTAPKTAPYAYISYKRAPNFQNKDYNKMLLTLSIASQMELKPVYLHNLHNNPLFIHLCWHTENHPACRESITYLREEDCSLMQLLH